MEGVTDPLEAFTASFQSDRILPGFGDPLTQFTYSRPPLPNLQLTIPDASVSQLFAHRQWRAGLRMANYIADGEISVSGKTVLEIGAGTGLPGIVSALKGSDRTVLTDYDDIKLLRVLRANVSCLPSDLAERTKVIGHIWGQDVEDLVEFTPSGFSIILCADVLWDTFSHPLLLSTLLSALARTADSRIVVISGLHTGRGPLARFLRLAAFRGLVPDSNGLREREVGGAERDWDEDRADGDIRERNRWTLEFQLMWEPQRLL